MNSCTGLNSAHRSAHSQLNQLGNQSVVAHTQAIAKPLSGPGSLTLTPAQVAGDTLIHLSLPRQTHLISSVSSPFTLFFLSLSLSSSAIQTTFPLSFTPSLSLSCAVSFSLYLCSHQFPCCCISLCILIHL